MARSNKEDLVVTCHSVIVTQECMSCLRSSVRHQTLYSLGVMPVDLCERLSFSNIFRSTRMVRAIRTLSTRQPIRELGPRYADAVMTCTIGTSGALSDLDNVKV